MPEFDARDHARQVNIAGDNTGIIDASVHQAPPPPRPVVTAALRRDIGVFIDRDHELQRILEAAGPARAVSVHTVDGMAGVGKTVLVTRAAHRLAPQFPDGCYFVDLHSHTPGHTPAEPADVLGGLLIGLREAVGIFRNLAVPETGPAASYLATLAGEARTADDR